MIASVDCRCLAPVVGQHDAVLIIWVESDFAGIAHRWAVAPCTSLNLIVLVNRSLPLRLRNEHAVVETGEIHRVRLRLWRSNAEGGHLFHGMDSGIIPLVFVNISTTFGGHDHWMLLFTQKRLRFLDRLLLCLQRPRAIVCVLSIALGKSHFPLTRNILVVTRCEHFLPDWRAEFHQDRGRLFMVVCLADESVSEVECTLIQPVAQRTDLRVRPIQI